MTGEIRSVEECIVELFDHLGIEQAHIAAGRLVRGDWHGLATKHPERIASLTLISPQMLDPGDLAIWPLACLQWRGTGVLPLRARPNF